MFWMTVPIFKNINRMQLTKWEIIDPLFMHIFLHGAANNCLKISIHFYNKEILSKMS